MFQTKSLAFRLALILTTLIVMIMVAVAFFIDSQMRTVFSATVKNDSLQILSARAAELGALIDKYQSELRLLAIQPALQQSEKDAEKFATDMAGHLGDNINNVFVVWADGRTRIPAGTYINVGERAYFKAIFQGGKDEVTSDPVISKGTGQPAVILVKALKDKGGATRALLCAELSLVKISEITSAISMGATSYGWVVDGTGLVLTHKSKDAIMKVNITRADEENHYRGLTAASKDILSRDSWAGTFINPTGELYSAFSAVVPSTPGWRLGISVSVEELGAPLDRLDKFLFILFSISLVAVVSVVVFFVRWISKPLNTMKASLKLLAEGEADLTQKIKVSRQDEIGIMASNFNIFLDKLHEIVKKMKEVQRGISTISAQLNGGAVETLKRSEQIQDMVGSILERGRTQDESMDKATQALSHSFTGLEQLDMLISEQAASIIEASASIEEMVGNIASVTSSMEKIALEFNRLSSAAEVGKRAQAAVQECVAQISTQSENLMEANAVIGSIASQTNLLAMNAAIEAAHAGESGKGFSVVSEEIRHLAETAAEQSHTIGGQLRAIQEGIHSIVNASDESTRAFETLNTQITSLSGFVSEVKTAMVEQQEGSTQITEAIRDMNEVTSQVRTRSKELTAENKLILSEMNQLGQVTQGIRQTTQSIADSSLLIKEDAHRVLETVKTQEKSVEEMDSSIGRFRI